MSLNLIQIESPILFLNLILWITNILFTFLIIIYLFHRLYKKNENQEKKEERINLFNIITWLFFLILICIANIVMLLSRFLVMDDYLRSLLEKVSIILIQSAVLVRVVYLEYTIKKMKPYKGYYFSIISIITVLLYIFMSPEEFKEISMLQIILIVFIFFNFSILPILYFYLALKTTGKSRMNSLKISAGLVFVGLGLLFRPQNLEGYLELSQLLDILIVYTYITAPISVLIGIILISDSFRKGRFLERLRFQ